MKPRVFISSTRGVTIDAYREAVHKAVERFDMEPVWMEDMHPERLESAERCRQAVLSCDALVLLVSHRYGTLVPGHDLSYSELEYRTALTRPDMEILTWLADRDHPWRPNEMDDGAPAEKLRKFREELSNGKHMIRTFGEIGEFKQAAAFAMSTLAKTLRAAPEADVVPRPAPVRLQAAPPDPVMVPRYVGDTVFTGRTTQLRWLDEWAASGDPVAVVEAIGGTGKSALTWQWFLERAERSIPGLQGRFWWSFYDSSNTLTRFQQRLLQYVTGCSAADAEALDPVELGEAVLEALAVRPMLVVLDGFERLLNAYHRFDADTISDEEVDRLRYEDARAVTDPLAYDFLHSLASIDRSRILISTRLMPDALVGRSQHPLPGVQRLVLPGLTTEEAQRLLARLGVRASVSAVQEFFGTLDNHPLLIGVVAGLVADYRTAPNDFDRWLADPEHGQAFNVADVSATELSHRILSRALEGLSNKEWALLQGIAVTAGPSTWEMVKVINPHLPESPARLALGLPDYLIAFLQDRRARGGSQADQMALASLSLSLGGLESRGLLWWNREANSYDLHPIVRSYAAENTDDALRIATHRKLVRDHFGRQHGEPEARTVRSVDDLQTPIRHFRALIGAGLYEDAAAVWLRTLQHPLVFELDSNLTTIQLLEKLDEPQIPGKLRRAAIWNLGSAEAASGRVRSAYGRSLQALQISALHKRDRKAVLPALGNLIDYCRAVGRGADALVYFDFLNRFTWALEGSGSDRARLRLQLVDLLHSRNELEGAYEELQKLRSGPPCDTMPHWSYEMIHKEYELLAAMHRMDEVDELRVSDYRFGPTPGFRATWAGFVFRMAAGTGDPGMALEAAEQHDYWTRKIGRESLPAMTAWALAKAGSGDAVRLIEEVTLRFDRVDPEVRPHYWAARTYEELGNIEQATRHALVTYSIVWADGPASHDRGDVAEAGQLLARLGAPVPQFPARVPRVDDVPLAGALLSWLSELEQGRGSAGHE